MDLFVSSNEEGDGVPPGSVFAVLHCERECNRVAHEFAQLGKRSAQSTDYFSPFAVNNMQNLLL